MTAVLSNHERASAFRSFIAYDPVELTSLGNFYIGSDDATKSFSKYVLPVAPKECCNLDPIVLKQTESEHAPVLSNTPACKRAAQCSQSSNIVKEPTISSPVKNCNNQSRSPNDISDARLAMLSPSVLPEDCALNDGWRWLVILGSFLCLFVVEGICLCYGLYMYEMITDGHFFTTSANSTVTQHGPSLAMLSLPGALLCSACTLMGPLAGALVNCFGYRSVAGVGGVIAGTGLFLSSFSRESAWFTIFFGVVGGVGFGLIYLPAITVVGDWFEHRRAFIVGLALCGGGFGAGVLAPVILPLSQTVTWRGTVILTAALLFQILLGIALFRPLYTHEFIQLMQQQRREERKKHQMSKRRTASKCPNQHPLHVQRGSIMARIIEEKSRQRTTSTGSLDGMVITRENELVALSSPEAYEAARAAAAAFAAQLRQQADQQPQPATEDAKTNELTSPINSGINEKRSTCSQTRALQTLPEGIVLTADASRGKELQVAVIPPPVHFNRVAIRRIALAVVRKLQTNQMMTPGKHSVGLDSESTPSMCPSRVESWAGFVERRPHSERDSTIYSSSDAGEKQWKISLQPDAYPCAPSEQASCKLIDRSLQSLSQRTSLMSLDSGAAHFVAQEVNSLPLDEATKLAIQIAIRAELNRPKYRADFFHPGSHRLSSTGAAFDARIGESNYPKTNSVGDPKVAALSGDHRQSDPSGLVRTTFVKFSSSVHTPQLRTMDRMPRDSVPTTIPNELVSNWSEICAYLRFMLDPEPLRSPTFQLLLVACSLHIVVFWVPYHYMPLLLQFAGAECTRNRLWCPEGLPQETNLKPDWLNQLVRWTSQGADGPFPFFLTPGSVLSTIGFSNIIGRIVASLYIERGSNTNCKVFQCCPRLRNPLVLNNISLLLCALALCCYPLSIHGLSSSPSNLGRGGMGKENAAVPTQALSMSLRVFLVYAASVVYGAAGATALSLRSVTLVELFGIRRLTNAFGYLLIFQGLAVMCGLPLFGYFCDSRCYHLLQSLHEPASSTLLEPVASQVGWCARRLNLAFYLCAALFVLTTLLFLPLRWLSIRDACCGRPGPAVSDRWTLRFPMHDELADPAVEGPTQTNGQSDPQVTQTTQVLSSP